MALSDNIRAARIQKGLNQKKLAYALSLNGVNVGNTTISNWENGFAKPDPDTIILLCKILGVDANTLLDFPHTHSSLDVLFLRAKNNLNQEEKDIIEFILNNAMKRI